MTEVSISSLRPMTTVLSIHAIRVESEAQNHTRL